jgi:thioredoxin 1
MEVFARKSAQGGPRPDEIRTVTSDTFTSLVIQGEGPIVVEFMSYGCAHCRVMEPILQEVAEMVKPQATIFRVNIAVERELSDSYDIEGTPTLWMFLEGKEVARAERPRPTAAKLLTTITEPFRMKAGADI